MLHDIYFMFFSCSRCLKSECFTHIEPCNSDKPGASSSNVRLVASVQRLLEVSLLAFWGNFEIFLLATLLTLNVCGNLHFTHPKYIPGFLGKEDGNRVIKKLGTARFIPRMGSPE